MGIGGPQKVFSSVKSFSARGKLLSKKELQTLAESRDLDELVTRIKNTAYADSISKLTTPFTPEKIEALLRSRLAEVHYSLGKSVGGSAVLKAYYLKLLIWNLKLIFKGKVLGIPSEQIESRINLRAEELIGRRDVIVKALVAKDIEEAAASLASSEFGDEVAKAVALYNEKKDVQVFDIYFEKIFYKQLGTAMKRSGERDVVPLIRMDIDFFNLLSTLRGKFWGLEEQQILDLIVTYTSTVSRDLIARLCAMESVADAFSELENTYYKEMIPETKVPIEAISQFERSFELEIFRTVNRTFTKMFSLSNVIGILKLTTFEVRNLSAIAYAVQQKIDPQITMSKIITVE